MELRIPREIIGALIGKDGNHIGIIEEKSGARIQINRGHNPNAGEQSCIIMGSLENITAAQTLIEKFIMGQPILNSITFTVPSSSVGRIMGPGGMTIRNIREISQARVYMDNDSHYGVFGLARSVMIKGSEEQIMIARQLIMEKVNQDILPDPSSIKPTTSLGVGSVNQVSNSMKENGVFEIFVSCAYHPNDFWIQAIRGDSIKLEMLCKSMTEFYKSDTYVKPEVFKYNVGEIVAAPFDEDGQIYRAKILSTDEDKAEIFYLDYGDHRVVSLSKIYELHSDFTHLTFQAIHSTLNLGCIGGKWEDDVIGEFCDLTSCAQWKPLTAKVKERLKDAEDGHDVMWIELFDMGTNIGEKLVRKRLATPDGPSGRKSIQALPKKSYAAVVRGAGL